MKIYSDVVTVVKITKLLAAHFLHFYILKATMTTATDFSK